MIYLFDIDGTIADITHRLHFLQKTSNDAVADFPAEGWLDQVFDYSVQNLTPVLIGLTQTDVFLERMNAQ